MTHRIPTLTFVLSLLVPVTVSGESPWTVLEALREHLQDSGPTSSRFVQTYVPAGFDSGDEESGHLSMWLPDCLRWNYEVPAEKSFLVCQGEVYFWNEGEAVGKRYRIEPEKEPGLDLLLVSLPTLRQRYLASSRQLDDGSHEISLSTPPSEESRFSAKIRIDGSRKRVLGLEYTDEDGNLTRFRLSDYTTLRHTALFQPPTDIEWTEE